MRRPRLPFLASLYLVLLATSALAQGLPSAAPQPVAPQPRDLQPFLLGGIQTHELDHQRWVAALHKSGMNAVQATVYAHQGPWNTSKLWFDEEAPSVLDEIRSARQNGLQVVLVLRVALDHKYTENRHLWHGLIYPESKKATLEWFQIYSAFVVKWARIAEEQGVEVLGIGSEMNSLAATLPVDELPALPEYYLDDESQDRLRALVGRSEHLFSEDVRVSMGAGDFRSLDDFLVQRNQAERRWARAYTFAGPSAHEDSDQVDSDQVDSDQVDNDRVQSINRRRQFLEAQWRELVRKVREVYSGRLTLAANFDNYHEVAFWDALDFIGINAYFPLREALETPLSEEGLADAWRKVFDQVEAFKEEHKLSQKVIFTELGYTRRRGVTVAPWSSKGFIPLWDPEGETENDRAFFWSAQPIEPAERALALQALHRVWREGETSLGGVLYWKLSSLLDFQRFEPFMLHLGERSGDPLYTTFTQFAEGIRPLSPFLVGDDSYLRAMDAIVRDDLEALTGMGSKAVNAPTRGRTPPLHLAVRLGRGRIVRHLLEAGADPEQRDSGGFLPLHWTCFQKDPDLVRLLQLAAGESQLDARKEPPLMKCVRLDNPTVARQLLKGQREQVQAVNELGQNALHLAADQASVEMVDLLISAGGDVAAYDEQGQTPLHIAARRGELEIVRALAKDSKGSLNRDGNRPAQEAAIHGRQDVFQLLFEPQRARETNVYGQTVLHLAAHGGDLEILKTLLEHFPDVDPMDHDGWTPLAFATRNAQTEAVEILLQKGASLEHRNREGTSPLHLAAASFEPRLMQQLVRQKVNVDLPDNKGNTPLHHSAGWGYAENVRLLLEAGANVNFRNREGDTPLDLAERHEKLRTIELMRAAKAREPKPLQ